MSIQVGLFNWELFQSNAGFYPADLPAEWKLQYYANEFNSACINLANVQLSEHQVTEMLEDLPASFELSIAIGAQSQLDEWVRFCQPGSIECRFVVLPEIQMVEPLLQDSVKTGLQRIGVTETKQLVTSAAFWTPQSATTSSRIALLPEQENMKIYRGWIEQWINAQGTDSPLRNSSTLWLEGNKSSYFTLSRLRSLVELMGY